MYTIVPGTVRPILKPSLAKVVALRPAKRLSDSRLAHLVDLACRSYCAISDASSSSIDYRQYTTRYVYFTRTTTVVYVHRLNMNPRLTAAGKDGGLSLFLRSREEPRYSHGAMD